MQESKNALIKETTNKQYNNIDIKESKEIILQLSKFISFCILLLNFILQFEFLLHYILKIITNNNTFIIYTIIILFHIILIRYAVQSFLYILQSPILKQLCFYNISCNQLKELLDISKDFVNFYNLKKLKKVFNKNDLRFLDEISNLTSLYITFFEEIKPNTKLSIAQINIYNYLCSWMKYYKTFKNKIIINLNRHKERNKEEHNKINKEDNKNNEENIEYYLENMKKESNGIITLLSNFICNDYQPLSIKKLYNCFINNTFTNLDQYSVLFNRKFNNKYNSFITSDNKIIDYTIITYDKLNIIYKNNVNYNENKISNNLLIFCNPNGMIYQLFTPEKFLFLLNGGCDVLLWNYRGYGYSTGHPTFKNAKTDVMELFDYIKKKNQYKKFGVFGYSVGGGCATFLAQNRKLDVLICDRNYSNISEIAKAFPFIGKILYYLSKIVCFKYDDNISEFINTKNKNILKIVLCDPDDEIIPDTASIKSGISKYIIKEYCKENNIKRTENILDLFLNIENNINQKNKFIESLLFILNIWIEFNENPLKDLIKKKNKPKLEENIDKSHLINVNENNELNKNNLNKKLIHTIIKFFKCFNYSSENLEALREINEKRLKILHIDTYFNNFFIWGTISKEKINNIDGFLNPFDTKNNIYYLNNAINCLNEFINDKFVKFMAGEDDNQEKYNNLITIKNCLQILKNKNEFLTSIKNINIGSLIRLDCGHNGIYSDVDEKNLIDILKDVDFIRYN